MGHQGVIQHGASTLGCASCTAAAVAPHDQSTALMLESDYSWHIRISGDQWIPPNHQHLFATGSPKKGTSISEKPHIRLAGFPVRYVPCFVCAEACLLRAQARDMGAPSINAVSERTLFECSILEWLQGMNCSCKD